VQLCLVRFFLKYQVLSAIPSIPVMPLTQGHSRTDDNSAVKLRLKRLDRRLGSRYLTGKPSCNGKPQAYNGRY
jgi:hypothetical protein